VDIRRKLERKNRHRECWGSQPAFVLGGRTDGSSPDLNGVRVPHVGLRRRPLERVAGTIVLCQRPSGSLIQPESILEWKRRGGSGSPRDRLSREQWIADAGLDAGDRGGNPLNFVRQRTRQAVAGVCKRCEVALNRPVES